MGNNPLIYVMAIIKNIKTISVMVHVLYEPSKESQSDYDRANR